jgi:DNA end-binding protein Ku
MWKAAVVFDDVRVPMKLYSAVQDRTVRFNLLHAKDETPVQQKMVNPATGDEIPRDQIKRGYAVDPQTYVVLDDDELAAVEPPPSRDIEIAHFLPADAIEHEWYDRPYWLGPDGDDEAYAALVDALAEKGRMGIARWVMRKRAYVGALRPEGRALALVTLRNADEVIPADKLKAPGGRKFDAKELKLAEQLVSALETKFDPTRYHDEYRERVLQLIETKRKGGTIKLRKPPRKAAPKSIESALRASLAAARKERERAAG